jgi:hypothetical protein
MLSAALLHEWKQRSGRQDGMTVRVWCQQRVVETAAQADRRYLQGIPTMKKTTYRLRNWSQYTNALKQRGSITFHFAPDVAQGWMSQHKTGRKGASPTYADQAIAACLSVKIVFGLPLRQTQGFVQSVLRLLDLSHLPTPDYSTLCRRQKDLSVPLSHSRSPVSRSMWWLTQQA